MKRRAASIISSFIGPAFGLIALAVYGLTLSSGAYPGESAFLIVQHTRLFPRLSPSDPLWHALVEIVSALPFGGLAFRLNALSALCGALSVWLIYEIVAGAVFGLIDVSDSNRLKARIAARLAGVAAGVFLAFCIPFWIVSNRAHTLSFDILMLLCATWLLVLYAKTGLQRFVMLFTFLFGMGIVESSTFLALAPFFGVYLVLLLWRQGHLRVRSVAGVLCCAVLGLSLYFVTAWAFYGSDGYVFRGYLSYLQILRFMVRDQYFEVTRSLPRIGWLLILCVTAVPWAVCAGVARRALNEEKDWTYYVLHVVVSALAVAVLWNVKFAPWPMLGHGKLLVAPYVLCASLYGYLIAYWYLLPGAWWPDTESRRKLWLKKWLGLVVVVPGLGLLCIAPFRNVGQADARPAGIINSYAAEILNSMQNRSWLITDGTLDGNLHVLAGERRRDLKIVNLRAAGHEVYMRYVASLFEKPRLKNLARIGLLPLVQEWLESEKDAAQDVAIVSDPDLWAGVGLTAVPMKLAFFGTRDPSGLDLDGIVAEHERFWAEVVPLVRAGLSSAGPTASIARLALAHMSKVANNLGVLLEDLGRQEQAFKAYRKAREIDPENLSALLNMVAMLDGGHKSPRGEELRGELIEVVDNLKKRYHIWSLAQRYGYVRLPQAFVNLGWTWALSGQRSLAVSSLKKAMSLLPDDKRSSVKRTLADVYFLKGEDEESEVLYRELLAENPASTHGLLGLARLAARELRFEQATDLLRKAEQAGAPQERMDLEWASMFVKKGDAARARKILEELVENKPNYRQGWALLIAVLVHQNDGDTLAQYIPRIEEQEEQRGLLSTIARGHLAMLQNDLEAARRHFESALALRPDNIQALELLLRLDVIETREKDAAEHVETLLQANPANALGNYILGSLQLENGEYALAEDSFRRSLEARKSPDVMNDLAWLLQSRNRYAEAEEFVRAALELNDKFPEVWDTLGVILMRTERLTEAETAFRRSLGIFRGNLEVFIHMAELQIMRGDKGRAQEIIDMLSGKRSQLSSESQDKLASLRRKVERM